MASHINPDPGTLVIKGTNVLDVTAADLIQASELSAFTPISLVNGTSFQLTTVGDSIDLVYTTAAWSILSIFSNTSVS